MADEITTRNIYVGSGVYVDVVDNPADSAGYFKALDAYEAEEEKRIGAIDSSKTKEGLKAEPVEPEPGPEQPEAKAAAAPANKSRAASTKAAPTVEELNA